MNSKKRINDFWFPSSNKNKVSRKSVDIDFEIRCPVCNLKLWSDESLINLHIDACLSKQVKSDSQDTKYMNSNKNSPNIPLSLCSYYAEEHKDIKGLWIIPDFISKEEEESLIESMDNDKSTQWYQSSFNGHCLSKVFGVRTQFGLPNEPRIVRENDPSLGEHDLPVYLTPFVERLKNIVSLNRELPFELREFLPNECNYNSYHKSKGHYLKPHFDDRFLSGPLLMNLSLVGNSKMTYHRPDNPSHKIKVDLPPRTLQLITGPARWDFMHSISGEDVLDERRVSITWRQSGSKKTGIQPLPVISNKSIVNNLIPKSV